MESMDKAVESNQALGANLLDEVLAQTKITPSMKAMILQRKAWQHSSAM
ncbi:hypothetical protein [Shewanella psychropiezotolerans]